MKMYVVMYNFDNGETYEEKVVYDNSFEGLFSTKELATAFAKCKASKAFEDLKRYEDDDDYYDVPWYVFEVTHVQMDEKGMGVIFNGTGGRHGFIKYYIVEVEVDQEWRPERND